MKGYLIFAISFLSLLLVFFIVLIILHLRSIKIRIGSAYQVPDLEESMEVKGRDLVSGLPKSIRVSSQEIRTALQEPIASIVDAVRSTLEHCPPELASDLMDRGIMLAGGGAKIRGLDRLISEEMNLPVGVAEKPLNAVAEGTGEVLKELSSMQL